MKKKLFTLLTLLVLCVTGAWASQTSLIDGITLPDIPSGTIDMSDQTDFTPVEDGWIIFNPYTALSAKAYWTNNSGNKNGTTWEVPPTAIAPFVGAVSSTNSHTLRNNRTYALRFTGAEAVSFLVKAAASTKKAIVSLYSYDGETQTQVGSTKECTSTDATELLFDGLTTTITYIAYIYSNNSDSNSYVPEIGIKAPTTPSTKTTKHSAEENQHAWVDNKGIVGSIVESKCDYTFASYPLKIVGSGSATKYFETNYGSAWTISATDYIPVKVTKNIKYVIEPLNGCTIKSATAYAKTNSNDKYSTITSGLTTETLNHDDAVKSISLTTEDGKYYFSIAGTASQALVVIDVVYDMAENVDVKVSSAGYATLFYDKKLAIPAGVTAYSASVSGANALLTPIADVIPAETGVILKGDAGTYKFVVTTADAPVVSGNVLKGTTSATTVADIKTALSATKVFTLGQNASSEVGLREYSGSDIRAYCAYAVDLSFDPGANFFSFDEDVTAINKVEAKKVENGVYYNLAGQQVAQPTKGLYIVNGKKVVLK